MPTIREVLIPLLAAVIGGAGTVFVGLSGHFNKNREMDIKMLELSLQILREDPSQSQINSARGWAVDLINHVSPVRIPTDARDQLIKNKLPEQVGWFARDEEGKLGWQRRIEKMRDKQRVEGKAQ